MLMKKIAVHIYIKKTLTKFAISQKLKTLLVSKRWLIAHILNFNITVFFNKFMAIIKIYNEFYFKLSKY